MAHEPDGVIDYGATPHTDFTTTSSDQNINGLLYGKKWTDTELTYSFPDKISDYNSGSYPNWASHATSFTTFSVDQVASADYWLDQFRGVCGLSFVGLSGAEGAQDEDQEAALRFGNSNDPDGAYAHYVRSEDYGGDTWYDGGGDLPDRGNNDWRTIGHELGHAVGLGHPHEDDGFGIMTADRDSSEFSIMSYRPYIGADTAHPTGYSNANDSFPQTLMMYDIAALQFLYGANFTHNATSNTYTFDPTTGEMSINGIGQGAPIGNIIYQTIWDGNGSDDHYDHSNYSTDLAIDLTPGGWSDFDVGGNAQRADLDKNDPGQNHARGHVFNALQYEGDDRSLIEHATGGSGSDLIEGNAARNMLLGNAGDDTLWAYDGADTLNGGLGNDSLVGGGGLLDDTDTALFLGSADITVDLTTSSGQNTGHGTDTLIGIENVTSGTGNDSLTGNSGHNTLIADAGNDSLDGGTGNDSLDGGDGDDALYFTGSADVTVDLRISGGQATGHGTDTIVGIENIWSAEGDDKLYGDDKVNVLHGGTSVGSGNDELYGFGDDDSLYAKYGADELYGGTGNDFLYTYLDDASDELHGEAGNDELHASNWRSYSAVDKLYGGDGDDTLYLAQDLVSLGGIDHLLDGGDGAADVLHVNYSGAETSAIVFVLDPTGASQTLPGGGNVQALERLIMNTGRGDDHITGAAGNDTIGGNRGADTLIGNGGNDRLTTTISDTVGDDLRGGDGLDTLMASNAADTLDGGAGNDSLYGYGGNDTLTGGDDDDLLNGGGDVDLARFTGAAPITVDLRVVGGQNTGQGIDTLESIENVEAGSGRDRLTGDGQNNLLTGNGGKDTLDGGIGADTMRGGIGNDLYVVDNAGDTVSEAGGSGVDKVNSSVSFALGAGLDNLTLVGAGNLNGTGNGARNAVFGNDGKNTLKGLGGNDTLKGYDGNDKLFGGNQNDKLYGLNDNDILKGDKGNDRLFGGNHNDKLYGGKGKDVLEGGGGKDQFQGDAGNDRIIGGGGSDTAVYSGKIGRYDVVKAGSKVKVIDTTGKLGTDILSGVEKLKFGGKVYTVKKALKASGASKKAAAEDDGADDPSGHGETDGLEFADFLLETMFGVDDLLV